MLVQEALAQGGFPYQELDVSKDAGLREAVKQASGSRTVPQVCIVSCMCVLGCWVGACRQAQGENNWACGMMRRMGGSIVLERSSLIKGAMSSLFEPLQPPSV